MVSLKDMFLNKVDEFPLNYNPEKSSTGIYHIYKFNNEKYRGGYGWRYLCRKKGVQYTCSSTDLLSLLLKCVDKNYPLIIVDEDKAKFTLESEGITMDFLEKMECKL